MIQVVKQIIVENQELELPEMKPRIVDVPDSNGLVITLIGTRRSGKTFLLYQKMQELKKRGVSSKQIVFVNFEDERIPFAAENLDLILQAYRELFINSNLKDVHFFFDEIQNVRGWEKFVRRVFDTISKNIYITGSNAKLLSTEIATELRGRTITIPVYPLSLKEYLAFNNIEAVFATSKQKANVVYYNEKFLFNGGFPELINLDDRLRVQVLQNYLNVMIFRDIVERYEIKNIDVLKYFIKKIFASVSKPFSVNKTYNDLRSQGYKISNNYLYDFFVYCDAIFLTQSIKRFDYSEIKQAKSESKAYVIDTGLLSAVEFSVSQNKGKLLENLVFLELLKQGKEIFYYKNKYECDFVVRDNNNLVPIQVSYSIQDDDTRKREISGLLEAAKYLNVNQGIILTFDEENHIEANGCTIKVMPVYKYFLA